MMGESTAIMLGDGAEFDRVREIAAALGDRAGPLGDDTAAIPPGTGTLVVSTDVSVEGVHFRRDWLTCEEIGWRATVAALSDLAAAAAIPAGLVVALTVPTDATPDDTIAVMRGVGDAARASGTKVLGGDLSSGPAWSLAVTVFGHSARLMSRRGALPGDGVWVTGWLGGAHAALRDWTAGREPEPTLREMFAKPLPRLAVARWLAERGATSMIDLSDGIAGDARHLAAASDVRLEIDIGAIPLGAGVAEAAAACGADAALDAATGGEDYELLVTLPADFAAQDACRLATGVPLTRIGTVVRGHGSAVLRDGVAVNVRSFRHPV